MFRFILDPMFPTVFGAQGRVCRLSRQFENIVNSQLIEPVETKIYRLDREAFLGVSLPYSVLSDSMDKAHENVLGDVLSCIDDLKNKEDSDLWKMTKQVLVEHSLPSSSETSEDEDFVIARQLHQVTPFSLPRAEFAVASVDSNGFHALGLYDLSRSAALGMKVRNPVSIQSKVWEDDFVLPAYKMKNNPV